MNENEFELNGKRYKAVPAKIRCTGCVFTFGSADCAAAPPCISYVGGEHSFVRFVEIPKQKTNGDRFRAMSNEELAEYMCDNGRDCDDCIIEEFCKHIGLGCKGSWLKWLNSPAESGKGCCHD